MSATRALCHCSKHPDAAPPRVKHTAIASNFHCQLTRQPGREDWGEASKHVPEGSIEKITRLGCE
jgi:hypothetical protein